MNWDSHLINETEKYYKELEEELEEPEPEDIDFYSKYEDKIKHKEFAGVE